ncbi:unnamed protein product [Closterium sp. NIES-65]|nr:unnamed protein product [Closterium sp. NIES-65]
MSLALRHVPWASWEEWEAVRSSLLGPAATRESISFGIDRVAAWQIRGRVPASVDVTAGMLAVKLQDPDLWPPNAVPPLPPFVLRQSYAAVIISPGSVSALAHNRLLQLPVLRLAVTQALGWLVSNYWSRQAAMLAASSEDAEGKFSSFRRLIVCYHHHCPLCCPRSHSHSAPSPSPLFSPQALGWLVSNYWSRQAAMLAASSEDAEGKFSSFRRLSATTNTAAARANANANAKRSFPASPKPAAAAVVVRGGSRGVGGEGNEVWTGGERMCEGMGGGGEDREGVRGEGGWRDEEEWREIMQCLEWLLMEGELEEEEGEEKGDGQRGGMIKAVQKVWWGDSAEGREGRRRRRWKRGGRGGGGRGRPHHNDSSPSHGKWFPLPLLPACATRCLHALPSCPRLPHVLADVALALADRMIQKEEEEGDERKGKGGCGGDGSQGGRSGGGKSKGGGGGTKRSKGRGAEMSWRIQQLVRHGLVEWWEERGAGRSCCWLCWLPYYRAWCGLHVTVVG